MRFQLFACQPRSGARAAEGIDHYRILLRGFESDSQKVKRLAGQRMILIALWLIVIQMVVCLRSEYQGYLPFCKIIEEDRFMLPLIIRATEREAVLGLQIHTGKVEARDR